MRVRRKNKGNKILSPRYRSPLEFRRLLQLQLKKETMISILAQERLLGATLGALFTGAIVFEQRRYIYRSISETTQSQSPHQVREPIVGKKTRPELAHLWNKTVDQTFGPLIQSLSSRGW